jgi:hypothetical protein
VNNTKPDKKRLTMNEVMNLSEENIEHATKEELAKYTRVLADVGNKRLKRLESTGYDEISPAYLTVEKGGKRGQGKFSTKGKTRNQLLAEFTRAKGFLNAKTSTVSGSKKLQADVKIRLGNNVSIDEQKRIWEIYNELKSKNYALFSIIGSDRIQKLVAEKSELFDNVTDAIEGIQKEMKQIHKEFSEAEEFFTINKDKGKLL